MSEHDHDHSHASITNGDEPAAATATRSADVRDGTLAGAEERSLRPFSPSAL